MNSTGSTNASPKEVYLGWSSQDRLDIGPAYLASPAQRLASSVVPCQAAPGSSVGMTEDTVTGGDCFEEDTEAVHANNYQADKPPQVKQAWPQVEDESDYNSDAMDDDSGIDRSDDFREEIINEI